jgi:hypothetical protein
MIICSKYVEINHETDIMDTILTQQELRTKLYGSESENLREKYSQNCLERSVM